MRVVVDTNVLFSYFWKNSRTRRILIDQNLEFFSPEFALKEIEKYKKEIMQKTNLSIEEFNKKREQLVIDIEFIPIEEYKEYLRKSLKISPDKNDIDFFALALKLKCPLWSNDKLLKRQDKIKVYNAQEIIRIL